MTPPTESLGGERTLAELQRRMRDWVSAPEGVAIAIAEADARGGPDDPAGSTALARLVRSDARLAAVARLEIYANAYFHRIREALEQDYARLCGALGAEDFNDLITSYLLVHPPRHYSLRYAGDRLAAFLGAHDATGSLRAQAPWAADLARLEWAMVDAFDARDGEHWTRDELAGLAPDSWAALELRLDAAAQRLDCGWPVHEIEADGSHADLAPRPTALFVWRRRERVAFRTLDAEEAFALDCLGDGIPFGTLCEQLAERSDDEQAPQRAAALLARWADDALLLRR